MNYSDKRTHGIALLRQHTRELAQAGDVRKAYADLTSATNALEQEFFTEFDMPGVRYWLHPESDCYFATPPGRGVGEGIDAELCVELARHEFLSRQGIWRSYEEDAL